MMTVNLPSVLHSQAQQCRLCRKPLESHCAADKSVCSDPVCQTRARIEQAGNIGQDRKRREEAWDRLTRARTSEMMSTVATVAGEEDLDKIAHGFTPYIDLPLVPLETRRREVFLAHLEEIIRNSFAETPPIFGDLADDTEVAEPEIFNEELARQRQSEEADDPPALTAACIACQGECCLQANTRNAFLTQASIDYVRWRNPGIEAETILDTYVELLPETSISGSCVYHGPKGCVVPRSWRAQICNTFQCSWRMRLIEQFETKGDKRSAVIGVARDHTDYPEAGVACFKAIAVTADGDIMEPEGLSLPRLPYGD